MSTQETRIRLLETALRLIWQSNYASVGVNEICKQAGVTKGGFYHHFESKANLFCEATQYYWDSVKKDMDAIMSPITPPLEQLEKVIAFIFTRKFDQKVGGVRGCPLFSAGSQSGCGGDQIQQSLIQMSENATKYNRALVQTLHAAGYLETSASGEVDIDSRARLMSQYIQGAVSFARVNGCIETIKRDLPEGIYRSIGLKNEHWYSNREAAAG